METYISRTLLKPFGFVHNGWRKNRAFYTLINENTQNFNKVI